MAQISRSLPCAKLSGHRSSHPAASRRWWCAPKWSVLKKSLPGMNNTFSGLTSAPLARRSCNAVQNIFSIMSASQSRPPGFRPTGDLAQMVVAHGDFQEAAAFVGARERRQYRSRLPEFLQHSLEHSLKLQLGGRAPGGHAADRLHPFNLPGE